MQLFRIVLLGLLSGCLLRGAGFENFITVFGHRLLDGDQEFRFLSFNVPTLNYQEDELAFRTMNPYALPTEFEMRDVFATVREMGGRVIRIYTIPVRNRNFPAEAPTYVEGPGQFNEPAFQVTDRMLALANEYGVRIIFSLLNNHQWMGGRPNYAAFRGKTADDFWTDPQLRADLKATIAFTLNRRNTLTRVAYKDDKAILCWETGNELACPESWTTEICRYLKSLDRNHLVMDGYYAIDSVPVRESSVLEASIDIISSHHYERDPAETLANIARNRAVVAGRKPYLIGEVGFASTTALEHVFATIAATPDLCGALIWSLRHHREKGGFYWHSEPFGIGLYKAYHFPGFASGAAYDEANFLTMMRRRAFAIQGRPAPPLSVPAAPELLPIERPYAITWKGSAGAAGYNVERAVAADGPWEVVGYHISDAEMPYFPLFQDVTAAVGRTFFYRVRALNVSGVSVPSNVQGPVNTDRLALIDRMQNLGAVYESKNVKPVSGDDRGCKELLGRLEGDYGSEATYFQPGTLRGLTVYAFERNRFIGLKILGSMNGQTWEDLEIVPQAFVNAEINYTYLQPKTYTYAGPRDFRYLKLVFRGKVQLARLEIEYTP